VSAEPDILLGVLDAVERDPTLTQRSVARDLGIALGLVNTYLKRCVRKGLVKVSQVPRRRYAYYLTPQGFAEKSRLTADYLAHSFAFFRRARSQCEDLLVAISERGQHRLALVGDGDLSEIARLIAREHSMEVAGIAAASGDPGVLATNLAALGKVDAVIITALVGSRDVFNAAVSILGEDRVYAPPLLRVHLSTPRTEEAVS